jgi:transcriptional regulator with XRE-family HTH domain
LRNKRSEQEIAFSKAQGRMLYALRNERELTRRDLAAITGVNMWTLYRIEMGDTTATAYQIDAISSALAARRESLFPGRRGMVLSIETERGRVYA